MRIFPSDFIHGSGFKNIISDGNFRIQLLIIDDGHKLYKPLRYPNDFDYVNVSDKELLCYNFGENDSNYNNRSVSNYTYSSFKPIDFCHVKKHTGVDLSLGRDCHPNAKPMLPCYPNNNKLHVYKTSHSGTNINNRYFKDYDFKNVTAEQLTFSNFEQSKQHVLKESNEFLSTRKYTSARANNNDQSSVSHGNNGRYQVGTIQDSQSLLSTNLINHIEKKMQYDKGNIAEGILLRLDK